MCVETGIHFRYLLIIVSVICLTSCQQKQEKTSFNSAGDSAGNHAAQPLSRALRYLAAQQQPDHLWHSPNYGNLKEGAAVTCFVLRSLASIDPSDRGIDKSELQAAVDSLVPLVDEHGFVTNREGPDYTNYASSMFLVAIEKMDLTVPTSTRDKLIAYLVRAQLDEGEGFTPNDPDYGGWDLTGWMTGQRPSTGTNISVTCSVLESLAQHRNSEGVSEAMNKCRIWIAKCQNLDADGGFFFHPRRDHDGNKAGWRDGEKRMAPRSYGTATADGLRALEFLGASDSDPALSAARNWLAKHPELRVVPGFENQSGQGSLAEGSWAVGLRFYYYFTLSQTLHQFSTESAKKIASSLAEILQDEQNNDGSWQNSNARMREDDPIIATGFSVIALHQAGKWLMKKANGRQP